MACRLGAVIKIVALLVPSRGTRCGRLAFVLRQYSLCGLNPIVQLHGVELLIQLIQLIQVLQLHQVFDWDRTALVLYATELL